MTISLDSSLLLSYFQTRYGGTGASTGVTSADGSTVAKQYAPTAPWSATSTAEQTSQLVKDALNGHKLIDENAAKLDMPGASDDYKKMFALYQGLNALNGLAGQITDKTGATQKAQIIAAFQKGETEVKTYASGLNLDQLRITSGQAMSYDKSTIGVPKNNYSYTTQTLYTGTASDPVPAFAGNIAFNISVKKGNNTIPISIDLNDMGSTPRSMSNVTTFINSKLAAAGVQTRFAVDRTTAQPRTVTVGNSTVTLPAVGDALAFKINGDSIEQLTFSTATTTPAVYVTTKAGNPDPDNDPKTDDGVIENKLVKIDGAAAGAGAVGSRVFTDTLDGKITQVNATQVGADGSVYMLANVDGSADGQTSQGSSDAALLKYDTAGNLVYARTLGAADDASGYSLAVSSDGKVAIAGSVSGDLDGASNGSATAGAATNTTATNTTYSGGQDAFVTLYDANGDEMWTQRRGGTGTDTATDVAFGDDGTVYVAGNTSSKMPTVAANGKQDEFLMAIGTTAKTTGTGTTAVTTYTPKTTWTQQFGTSGDDHVGGLVVQGGQVIVGGVEGGHGILRSFDTTGAAGAVRDLGDLQGGDIAGMAIGDDGALYIGGQTRNGSLSVGGQSLAYTDGMDGFAARVSTTLGDTSADALGYYGDAANDTVTGMAVSGGKVYLTGLSNARLVSSSIPLTKQTGYVTQMDLSAGTVDWTQTLTGKDNILAPTSIAVSNTGASALDALGLPSGTIDYTPSQNLVSNTSLRPGDTFQVRTKEGGAYKTITIAANDTLTTLAAKVTKATGTSAKVEVVTSNGASVLKISPANDRSTVEVAPSKGGDGVLAALGLTAGVARNTDVDSKTGKVVSTDGGGKVYGLQLGALDLSTDDGVKAAQAALSQAMTVIQAAYNDLKQAAMPQTTQTNSKSGGTVPTYITNEIANYQAGLDRLQGASGGGSAASLFG